MDNYIVSARKYRPDTFDTVVGQHALTTTLKNAIASGKLAHAYLFCGPRGVGKTTCARIFAKTINCLHPSDNGEACDECESCKAFNEQRSLNIHELDAASNNSVEEIRALTRKKTAKHVANAKAARLSTRDEAITYTNLTRPQITRLKISAHSSNR